jgi:hypothetical protein
MTETMITREEAVKAADDYREAQTAIDKIEAHIKKKTAELNAKFENELHELNLIKQEQAEKLEAYVRENEEEVLGNARSTDFAGLKIGFRKGAKKLVTLGKKTWKQVLKFVTSDEAFCKAYAQQEIKLDKNAIKKAPEADLKAMGVKIEQEDNFFIDFK